MRSCEVSLEWRLRNGKAGPALGVPHGRAEVELSQQEEDPWPCHKEHPWVTPAHTSWLTLMTWQRRWHTSFKRPKTIPEESAKSSRRICPSHSETTLVRNLKLDRRTFQKQWFRSGYPAFCHEWKGKHERKWKPIKKMKTIAFVFILSIYTHIQKRVENSS